MVSDRLWRCGSKEDKGGQRGTKEDKGEGEEVACECNVARECVCAREREAENR